jgi:hypothetical protein
MAGLEHTDVDAGDLIRRYRAGRLASAEAEVFEEHYLHCARCLDQLEADAALERSLRVAAAQDAAAVARPLAVVAWLARLGRSRQAAAIAAVLLVALALPFTWQQHRLAEMARERDAARRAAQAAGPVGAPAAAASREREQALLEAERQRLARDLEQERRSRAALAERLERALAPQANTAIVRLSPLRSLGGEPADRLRLDRGTGWVVLALELPTSDYPSYRVRLTRVGAAREAVWSHAGLVPDAEGSLALSVHASMLAAGDYEAAVDGLAPGGKAVPVGRFTLRVVAALPR